MSSPVPTDVPSPIDFHDLAQARAWETNTIRTRPWRPRFFEAFADALNAWGDGPHDVLELGSGPGHLAAALLQRCRIGRYIACDFSGAMHELARENLGSAAARVSFRQVDFRDADWPERLGPVDAVVTLQAVHEVRHKDRQLPLMRNVHNTIRPGGLFLLCDHYWEPEVSWKQVPLYPTKDEQLSTLICAGFSEPSVLLDEGGMRLIKAQRS